MTTPIKIPAWQGALNIHNVPREVLREFYGDKAWDVRYETIGALVYYEEKLHTIVFIGNSQPGNGSFGRFMSWKEQEALEAGVDLMVAELWNKRLKRHLIFKRGYKATKKGNHVILRLRKRA